MSDPTHVSLQVVQLDTTQRPSRKLYVEIETDNGEKVHERVKLRSDGKPLSDATLTFPHSDTSTVVHVSLKKSRCIRKDRQIAHADIDILTLLQISAQQDGVAQLTLTATPSLSDRTPQCPVSVIHLRVDGSDALTRARLFVERAVNEAKTVGILEDKTDCINMVIDALDQTMKVVGKATEIHPLLEVSWKAATALYSLVSHQIKTDSKLKEMVGKMRESLDFTGEAEKLGEKTGALKSTIKELLQAAVECSRYVNEYTQHTFAGRMIQLDSNQMMDGYISRFVNLRKKLDSIIGLFTLAATVDIQSRQLLESALEPTKVDGSKISDRPRCLEGTRTDYLDDIKRMLFPEALTGKNAVWLTGAAGSGKSTVAVTIADACDEMKAPAAYFFFERSKSEYGSTIRNIAYKLANLHPSVAPYIVNAVRKNKNMSGNTLSKQFELLLRQPLEAAAAANALERPIVIILDALDECGTIQQRKELVQLLTLDFGRLPSKVRLLVTSRPETDIIKNLPSANHIHHIELEHGTTQSRNDVRAFIGKEMRKAVDGEPPNNLAWDEVALVLSEAADGLFIWASTAVKMVRESYNPQRKLRQLLDNMKSIGGDIDNLYATALDESRLWDDPGARDEFKRITGVVLFAKEAMTGEEIEESLGLEKGTADAVLGRLRSLLAYEAGQPVHLHHASFADYILSPERCKDERWRIDEVQEKQLLAERCFDVMKQGLQFNICGIESSFLRNNDVPELRNRIKTNIPTHLEYACRFWAVHFCELSDPKELMGSLKNFAYKQLLYWMEVLSLTKCFLRVAGDTLRNTCVKIASIDRETSAFLWDAYKLSISFWYPISQSAPHVYLSALTLGKGESAVADHYSGIHPVGQIRRYGRREPSRCIKIIEGHLSWVKSVAFSPNGRRLASGSDDRTVRVWDADSGELVLGPFVGHTDDVNSVAFSYDGRRIVSGSSDKTVRVWDANSGNLVAGPFEGHEGIVTSVAFSPGGNRIASGSHDGTVRVWNADTGELVSGPFTHSGAVISVAFSPNGQCVATGSVDGTVCVWDVNDGQPVSGPFEGHTDEVKSIAFSPDGRYVASGSGDKTIRVWNAETGALVSKPFKGHADAVTSVVFSPDGQRIASGSFDRTVIVWDLESSRIVSGPFRGHISYVSSVSFSPDGRLVASASWDKTVHIWDAESDRLFSDTSEGRPPRVLSAAFSHDGTRIVSGSEDGRVHVWDAGSGELVSGPFEAHAKPVCSVTFSLDGQRIASGSYGNTSTIRVWDTNTGKLLWSPLEGHTDWIDSVTLSPDGQKIVSNANDNSVRVWDVNDNESAVKILEGHTDRVLVVAFSPDGRFIVSGSNDKTIRIWDAGSGELVSGPFKGHLGGVLAVSFSRDGERVASGSSDKTIRVWDVDSGQLVLGPFEGHAQPICSVAFSPDGSFVVSSSWDGTVYIWNARTGAPVSGPFQSYSDQPSSVMFSADCSRILSCFFLNGIKVVRIEEEDFMADSVEGHLAAESSTLHPNAGPSDRTVETLASSSKGHATSYWTLSDDGWVLGRGGELLAWVPEELRGTLWMARTTACFNCQFSSRLDFSSSPVGVDWCKGFPLPE